MIDVKPLKEKILGMEDCVAKELIMKLPDEISKEDLISKFDFILQFMETEKKETKS